MGDCKGHLAILLSLIISFLILSYVIDYPHITTSLYLPHKAYFCVASLNCNWSLSRLFIQNGNLEGRKERQKDNFTIAGPQIGGRRTNHINSLTYTQGFQTNLQNLVRCINVKNSGPVEPGSSLRAGWFKPIWTVIQITNLNRVEPLTEPVFFTFIYLLVIQFNHHPEGLAGLIFKTLTYTSPKLQEMK